LTSKVTLLARNRVMGGVGRPPANPNPTKKESTPTGLFFITSTADKDVSLLP
jgi:hypothetical protein